MVIGAWAFGLAFIVTDPVTAAHTRAGRLLYGIIAGAFVVVVRVLNPVQLDGTAIALLFMSLFAPLIDSLQVDAGYEAALGAALGAYVTDQCILMPVVQTDDGQTALVGVAGHVHF